MESRKLTAQSLFIAYGALVLLLALSAWAANAHIAAMTKLVAALGIAAAKCAIVFWVFMQLKYQRGLIRVFALVGFFWLTIMGGLIFADYLTRGVG